MGAHHALTTAEKRQHPITLPCACAYIHIHTHIHTYIRTYIHSYTHTHKHTYTHTYTCAAKDEHTHIFAYMCHAYTTTDLQEPVPAAPVAAGCCPIGTIGSHTNDERCFVTTSTGGTRNQGVWVQLTEPKHKYINPTYTCFPTQWLHGFALARTKSVIARETPIIADLFSDVLHTHVHV